MQHINQPSNQCIVLDSVVTVKQIHKGLEVGRMLDSADLMQYTGHSPLPSKEKKKLFFALDGIICGPMARTIGPLSDCSQCL